MRVRWNLIFFHLTFKYYVLARDTKRPYGVISNRSQWEAGPDMVVSAGTWELHTHGAVIRRMRGTTAWIDPAPGEGQVTLNNFSTRPCTLWLVLPNGKYRKIHAGAGASFTIATADMRLD